MYKVTTIIGDREICDPTRYETKEQAAEAMKNYCEYVMELNEMHGTNVSVTMKMEVA